MRRRKFKYVKPAHRKELCEMTKEQLMTAHRASEFLPLRGENGTIGCASCGQPAFALLVRARKIRHIDPGLPDCDAGAL